MLIYKRKKVKPKFPEGKDVPLFKIPESESQKKLPWKIRSSFTNFDKKLFFSHFKDLCLYDLEILLIPQA